MTAALRGCRAAYYLVHGMGDGARDFRARELAAAETFADACREAGIERIVYLGGPDPGASPSEHLLARRDVGRILRHSGVRTLELRAAMIIGHGSDSWLIVRDLAARLPVMVLPRWLRARTCPVAIDDVLEALIQGLLVPLPESRWYDLPGPEELTGRQILERTARALGLRQPLAIEVPLLSLRLSSHWIRWITRASWPVARELVLGLSSDLLPSGESFWPVIGHEDLESFDEAAGRAIHEELAQHRRPRVERLFEGLRRDRGAGVH
jgi:uncharacterized protein YbjT (DUF2867 family)